MSDTFNQVLRKVCNQSLKIELNGYRQANTADELHLPLTKEQIHLLANKIIALPIEYLNILFFQYYFGFNVNETEDILDVENVLGKQRYIHHMLSSLMKIEHALIEPSAMKQACDIALKEYTSFHPAGIIVQPKYSYNFQRKLKKIRSAQKSSTFIIFVAKRVAVFALVCLLTFSAALAVNAEFREKVTVWFIETFPQFSIFSQRDEGTNELPDHSPASLKIEYIPEGFELSNTSEMPLLISYVYSNQLGDELRIAITTVPNYYSNTEGAEMTEIPFKDSSAFHWQEDNKFYFIWSQDGMTCRIISTTSLKVIMEIAKNITLQ